MVPRQTWTTFDEMATRLGTVRDVLSRALKAMEDEGLLRVDRREIDILDPGQGWQLAAIDSARPSPVSPVAALARRGRVKGPHTT